MTMRRRATRPVRTLLLLAALLLLRGATASACDPYGSDAPALEQARQAVSAQCDCEAAPSSGAYRECVRAVLGQLRTARTLTRSCAAHALRFENDSTCGRPGTVVCCRQSDFIQSTPLPFIRRVGQCGPYGERNVVHRAEGCSAYAPLRIVEPDRCGDGHVDPGEQCDPPNGTTCSAWCGSCRSSEGPTKERTLACLDNDSAIGVAASQGTFLATFSAGSRTGSRAMAQRLDASGKLLGAPLPVASAGAIARRPGSSFADAVTADQDGFYVSWTWNRGFEGAWRGRRLLPSGAPASGVEELYSYGFAGPGMCGPSYFRGPLALATTLDESGVHSILTQGQRCTYEWLLGVPFQFGVTRESPGILKSGGGGRLARGASDVAALWRVTEIAYPDPYVPPGVHSFLYAGWIEPGAQAAFPLVAFPPLDLESPAPTVEGSGTGLAAVGDVFLATSISSDGIRGMRFSRSGGLLDQAPGMLLVPGEQIADSVATSDGVRWVLAWSETRGADRQVVRIVRVASDGSVVDEEPIDAVDSPSLGRFGIAADATSIIVVYTESGAGEGTVAVRMVRLPS